MAVLLSGAIRREAGLTGITIELRVVNIKRIFGLPGKRKGRRGRGREEEEEG